MPNVNCRADGSPRCSEPIFAVNCTVYNGTIGMWFGADIRDIPPLVLKDHLAGLGLHGLTHILEDLLIMLPVGDVEAPP